MEWAWGGGVEVNQTCPQAQGKKVVDVKTVFRSPSHTLTPNHRSQLLVPLLPGDLSVGLVSA